MWIKLHFLQVYDWLIDWLIHCLIDWLIDLLTDLFNLLRLINQKKTLNTDRIPFSICFYEICAKNYKNILEVGCMDMAESIVMSPRSL